MSKYIFRCGCGTHDVDTIEEEVVAIGSEYWTPLCAVRASARLIDDLRNKEYRLEKIVKEQSEAMTKLTRLQNKLNKIHCRECGFEVGKRWEISAGEIYCRECFYRYNNPDFGGEG
jgi:hypothetical protein